MASKFGSKIKSFAKKIGTGAKVLAQTGSLQRAIRSAKSSGGPALVAPATSSGLQTIKKQGSYMAPKNNFIGLPKMGMPDKQISALKKSSTSPLPFGPAAGLPFTPMPNSAMNYSAVPGSSSDFGPKFTAGIPNSGAGAIGSSVNYNNPLTGGGISEGSYKGAPGMPTTSYSAPKTANAGYTGSLDASASMVADKKDQAETPEEYDYWDKQEQKIQRQMERLMRESQDEMNTQAQIDALANDERLVEAGLEQKTQDVNAEPIPMAYLQGWGTTFNKQANAKLQGIAATRVPLEVRLANLQQKRQSALDVVKQRYNEVSGRAKENRGRKYDLEDYNRKRRDELADRAYKSGSGGFSYSNSAYSADSQALEQSRGSDGHVDPNIYLTLFKAWTSKGGTLAGFKKKFPPKDYINPSNTWMPSYLMPTASSSSSQNAF